MRKEGRDRQTDRERETERERDREKETDRHRDRQTDRERERESLSAARPLQTKLCLSAIYCHTHCNTLQHTATHCNICSTSRRRS